MIQLKRSPALDIARCFALLCVVTYHFFAYTSFYNASIQGIRMYLLVILYFTALLGVPLFLMLSGYLMGSKRPQIRYYKKLPYTLGVYILCSCLCYGYRWFAKTEPAVAGNWGDLAAKTLDYSAIPHAWYIAMYIGLFLIIPYLNILYDAMEDKHQKLGLILSFAAIASLPELSNILTVTNGQWLGFQLHTDSYQTLLPSYWTSLSPIVCYYLGRYLREYPLPWGPGTRFLAAAGASLAVGIGNLLLSHGTSLVLGPWCSYASPVTIGHAFLIFSFLSRLELPNWFSKSAPFWALLSRLSLGAYLLSWIFEDIFHKALQRYQPDGYARMLYLPIMVPAVYLCSLALSGVVEGVIVLLQKLKKP